MKTIVDVLTGEVKSGDHRVILNSSGIGSCIVVVAYDAHRKNGALAHIMLPGKASTKKITEKTKYAFDAIEELTDQLEKLGTKEHSIEVCLVGGGNVLKDFNSSICTDNLFSVENELAKRKIRVRAKAVGGTVRRTVSLNPGEGTVLFTEGDSAKKLLWKA